MRRLICAAVAAVAGFVLVAGCYGTGPTLHPTGAVCGGQSEEDAAECEGQVCLVLNPNQQNMPGMCSALCNVDDECTPHERCVFLDTDSVCLRACLTDDDCYDAFVCRLAALGSNTRFCIVDP